MTTLIDRAKQTYRKYGALETMRQIYGHVTLNHSPVKAARYWLSKKGKVTTSIQGSLMELDLRDRGACVDLWLDGIREPECTKYLQSILKPEWTVLEAGAHIGYYALMEARQVKQVYCVEPDPKSYDTLNKNIQLNGYTNIRAYPFAFGVHRQTAFFNTNLYSNLHRIEPSPKPSSALVPMVTVDQFLNEAPIDLLRMDVEGYELEILKGTEDTVKRNRLGMFIEVHRDLLRDYDGSLEELLGWLQGHGMQITKTIWSHEFKGRGDFYGRPDKFLLDREVQRIVHKPLASAFWLFLEKGGTG